MRPSRKKTIGPKFFENLDRQGVLNAISLRIVHFHLAEQGSLSFKLCSLANDYHLGVGRVKVFLGGVENIGSGESQNTLAIGFEVILRQPFERGGGELPGQTILRCQSQRKKAAQIIARVGQFVFSDSGRAHPVEFVEHLGQRGSPHVVPHSGRDAEIAVLAQRVRPAARTVGVPFLLANIH